MIRREEIVEALGDAAGSSIPGEPPAFDGVSTDSRTVRAGEIFVALRGDRYDGHDFVHEALRNGASLAVVDRNWASGGRVSGERLLRVPDTLGALQALARNHRRRWGGSLVAVTGSNGKTTTKEMSADILARRYRVHRTRGNLNNHIGLPLTLLGIGESHQWAVTELGMNHPGEIRLLAGIAVPTVAVITNVGPVHLEGVGNIDDVRNAKLEILDHTEGAVVVHADDERLLSEARKRARGPVLGFGFGPAADVRASSWRSVNGTTLVSLDGEREIALQVPGVFNVLNALAALAVARLAGIPEDDAAAALESFRSPSMRFEMMRVGSSSVVNDAYNANPESMKAALRAFVSLPAPAGGSVRRVAVLGMMNELGAEGPRLHRELGQEARGLGIDFLVGVGEMAKETIRGFDGPSAWYASAEEASRNAVAWHRPGDMVLLKGSRTLEVEKVLGGIRDAA